MSPLARRLRSRNTSSGVPVSGVRTSATSSSSRRAAEGTVLSRVKEACARGWRDRSRSVTTSPTTRSNGASECEKSRRAPDRTRLSRAAKLGSPDRSVRSTIVFTNGPIRPATSARPRSARVVQTAMSERPE